MSGNRLARAVADQPAEQPVMRRCEDDAHHRRALNHQPDIHGEGAAAVGTKEFLCAVDGIDEKEAGRRCEIVARRIFLGNHGNIRRHIGKRRQQNPFGSLVGLGHGRSVGLVAMGDAARMDFHDQGSGVTHRTDKTGKHAAAIIL